jgi:tetratricopeptide (TPR) repeat protein
MDADKVAATQGSKVGRARRALGQLWQVPTFFAGLLAVLALAASNPWRHPSPASEFEETLTTLRRGLEGSQDGDTLVGVADKALIQLPQFEQRAAEVHFLAGSAYLVQAQQRNKGQSRELWPRAAEHLERALTLGVDEQDLPTLQYRLGLALCRQDKDLPRAIELMTQAADHRAAPTLAGCRSLLHAYLKLQPPDLDGALAASQRVLELIDERDSETLARARLHHVDLLLRKGLRTEAVKELERVGPQVATTLRLQARLLRARICQEEGLWAQAAAIWKEILPDSEQAPGGPAAVYYQLGTCYQQAEPPDLAAAARAWQEALKLGGPEGQAAGLRLGELRLTARPPALAQALEDWRLALAPVQSAAGFQNPHLSLAQVRELFDLAVRQATQEENHAQARAFAELYRKVAPPGVAEEKQATAAEALARLLQARLDRKEQGVKLDTVRSEFRRAAQAFEQVAMAASQADQPEALWRATRCYLDGGEPDRAAAVLARYVQADRSNEQRLAEGWFSLGEAFRVQDKKEQARQAYYKCIEYPNTPYACRARYHLAVELITASGAGPKELGQARDILEQNIKAQLLDREAHEKSLFKLAWLLVQLQDFDRACIYLKEAAQRYPNNPHALFSRDQLGECYRRLAEQEHQKEMDLEGRSKAALPEEQRQQVESTIARHRSKRREWLDISAHTYRELLDLLESRQRASQGKALSELEQTLLRRAQFNLAENHFDLGEYGEALRLYQLLLQRYRGKVEVLIACFKICQLVAVMNQSPEQVAQVKQAAQEAVRLAEQDLQAMNADGDDFRGQLVWTRQEWLNWLAGARAQVSP